MSSDRKTTEYSDRRSLRIQTNDKNYKEQDLRKNVLLYNNQTTKNTVEDSGYDSRISEELNQSSSASVSEVKELIDESENQSESEFESEESVDQESDSYWEDNTTIELNILSNSSSVSNPEEVDLSNINSDTEEQINAKMAQESPLEVMQRLAAQMNILRDVISGIEIYDGKDGLSSFIAECKNAKAEISHNNMEKELIRAIVRTKLARSVRTQLQIPDNGYNMMQDLFKDLKQIKRGAKTEMQLLGEIGLMYQGEKESVREFGRRIREAGVLVNDVHTLAAGETTEQWTARLMDILQKSFKLGLKAEIGRMLTTGADLPADILAAAKLEEQETLRTGLRRSNGQYSNGQVAHSVEYSEVNNISEIRSCNYCEKNGHTEDVCFKKKNAKKGIKCYACNNTGHIARECTMNNTRVKFQNKQLNTGQQQTPVQCQLCKKMYHTADKCYQLNRTSEKKVQCRYCKKMGHSIEECRTKTTINPNQGNGQGPSPRNAWGGQRNSNRQMTAQNTKRVNVIAEESESEEE